MAASGIFAAAAPADATPLVGAQVTVNPPPQDSLLSLCVSSRSSRSGDCVEVGLPSPPPSPFPLGAPIGGGQFSVWMSFSGAGCRWGPWTFTGPIAAVTVDPGPPPGVVPVTDNTTVFGSIGATTPACDVPPFSMTSADGRVSGTCYGTQVQSAQIGFELRCIISIDGSPPTGVELQLQGNEQADSFPRSGSYHFGGVFVEYVATTGHPPV